MVPHSSATLLGQAPKTPLFSVATVENEPSSVTEALAPAGAASAREQSSAATGKPRSHLRRPERTPRLEPRLGIFPSPFPPQFSLGSASQPWSPLRIEISLYPLWGVRKKNYPIRKPP